MTTSDDAYPESDRPVEAWCDPHEVHVRLADGRHVSTPLWWYPRLLNATPAQRNTIELMLAGVHWPEVDEDLSVDGMLKGRKAPRCQSTAASRIAWQAERQDRSTRRDKYR